MELLTEMLARGWENFTARPSGALNLRFLIQPALAIMLAVRAGLKDARAGSPAYLWAVFTSPGHRWAFLKNGLKDLRIPFLVAATLDAIYQTMTHKAIYLFEMLFTVALLALIPYIFARGPTNRIARLLMRATAAREP
jgi:hypothetical protein